MRKGRGKFFGRDSHDLRDRKAGAGFAQRIAGESEEDWQSKAGPSASELFSPLQSVRNFGISQGQDRSLTLQNRLRLHDEGEVDETAFGGVEAAGEVDFAGRCAGCSLESPEGWR